MSQKQPNQRKHAATNPLTELEVKEIRASLFSKDLTRHRHLTDIPEKELLHILPVDRVKGLYPDAAASMDTRKYQSRDAARERNGISLKMTASRGEPLLELDLRESQFAFKRFLNVDYVQSVDPRRKETAGRQRSLPPDVTKELFERLDAFAIARGTREIHLTPMDEVRTRYFRRMGWEETESPGLMKRTPGKKMR